jgi:outer membrane translocation and assembly module TamA
LGGAFYSVANVEWDFPVSGALGGAVFADAGNLKTDASPGLDDFRLGLGIGLRYQLPIGPMRLDYGYNPSPREGEDPGAVHFSFGFAF